MMNVANILRQATPLVVLCAVVVLASCGKKIIGNRDAAQADSLMDAAYKARDYQQLITLADEQEADGALSKMKACYWRGYAYSRLRQRRPAESQWKKAVALDVQSHDDVEYYAMSASRLASMLLLANDYEATMTLCVSALKVMDEHAYDMNTDYASLQTSIASCQLKLGRPKEAATNFDRAYTKYQQVIDSDNSLANYTSAIIGMITTTDNYLLAGHYDEANAWTERFADLLKRYEQHPQANPSFLDKQWARLNLYRGSALEGLGRRQEASKAYHEALSTQYAKTDDGKIEATSYLISAHRWREAADNFTLLDAQLQRHNIKLTLDNIQAYLLPKYRANIGSQRIDTALAVGTLLCNALDSAIAWQKHDDAAELATIYETQEKETQIAQQQADINRQRLVTTIVLLVLVVTFFTVYIGNRRRAALKLKAAYNQLAEANSNLEHANSKLADANNQLAESNEQLMLANARAEESSKMKTNFIQQISHEIRTPLNILSGFTQIITTPGMELDDDTRNDINRQITDNTNRITGLVNKMLELSDAGSQADIERTDTVPAIQIAAEAADASGVTTAPHVAFDMQVAPEAETLMLQTNDASAARALTLLLDNARKFTRPAEATGEVLTGDKQKVLLSMSTAQGMAVFAVEDSGIGVPPAEADHIFDEFVQLNDYYDGTGIGLTVARSLARRLGGDVVLDTSYAPGARFVLTLPL